MPLVDVDALRAAYPALLGRAASLAVGAGWNRIVWDLCAELDGLSRRLEAQGQPPLRMYQMKEKYGTLRVQLRGYTNSEAQTLIEAAEARSEDTCEICGARGRLCTWLDWCKTLCTAHEWEARPLGSGSVQ